MVRSVHGYTKRRSHECAKEGVHLLASGGHRHCSRGHWRRNHTNRWCAACSRVDTGVLPWARKPDSSFLSFPSGQPRAPTPTPVSIVVGRPKRWAIDSEQRGGGVASSRSALRSAAATTAHYCCCTSSHMRLTDMSSVSILVTCASLSSVAIAVVLARLVHPPIFPRCHYPSPSRFASCTPCRTTTRRSARLPSAPAYRLALVQASAASPCPRNTRSRMLTTTLTL